MNNDSYAFRLTIRCLLFCYIAAFLPSLAQAEANVESVAKAVSASSIQSLQQDGKLTINTWLEPSDDIVMTQQVNLNIEVATHRWFVAGTQIGRLEVDDAIVLRRDSFAVNSSRRDQGESWAVQLWTITLYPQRSGQFKVPPIPVTVTVSGDDNQPVKGVVNTNGLVFDAIEPTGLKDKKGWIASTLVEVDDQFDKDITGLKKGDAVQRTVHFKAENIAAMMLPELSFGDIEGLGVYPKPSKIEDTVNRGEYLAERIETVTYVIEQAGEYRLPAITYYWWDLNSQAVQMIEIPEKVLSASGAANKASDNTLTQADPKGASIERSILLIAGLMAILLVLGMTILISKRRHQHRANKGETLKSLEKKFVAACQQQQYLAAVSLLYQWFDHRALSIGQKQAAGPVRQWLKQLNDQQLETQFNQLVAIACCDNTDTMPTVSGLSDNKRFEILLSRLRQQSNVSLSFSRFAKPVDLRLN